MWRFFYTPKWFAWSILGTLTIVGSIWYSVQLDVQINEWFGRFYDMLQQALSKPGSVSINDFYAQLFDFASIAAIYIAVNVVFNGFLVNHWTFRWRQSMAEYYQDNWVHARGIEGASQRLQEDTLKFARLTENLGVGLLEAVLMLVAFLPILYGLSKNVTELPFFGPVDHALLWVSLVTALGGTALLALVGIKLPGIEYDIQKREAAYRKELVLGEDKDDRAQPDSVEFLFADVRRIHFRSYLHYFYFNLSKWSYLQVMVIVPYVALAPTIIAGAITLGIVSQTVRAFGKVAESMQYIVRNWLGIVELISVHKRLREFERAITYNQQAGNSPISP
jgi:peptide/bleomycin uptake transporter